MSSGWENHEAAPLEFLHGRMMALFHEMRKTRTEDIEVTVSGHDINEIIAQAKRETYAKYPKQVSDKAILKSEL